MNGKSFLQMLYLSLGRKRVNTEKLLKEKIDLKAKLRPHQ